MKHQYSIFLFLFFCATLLAAVTLHAQDAQHRDARHVEYPRTHEKELKVIVEVSFGTFTLERCTSDKIAVVDYQESSDSKNKLQMSYDVSGGQGTLRIKLKESFELWDDSDHKHRDRHLCLQISDAVPVFFDVEYGAGKAMLDVTGLQVKGMQISTGASSVSLECSEPNRIVAQKISIESGVSKFTAHRLSNLNFRSLKFEGGVGTYKLDFGGSVRQDAEISVEVGLGSIILDVPKSVPEQLFYDDNWLSSFSVDDDFDKKQSGLYQTASFDDAKERLTFHIDAGLGSVKVRRK
jgi:hypothetical protein